MDFLPAGDVLKGAHQVRTVEIKNAAPLPDGKYSFNDSYCTDTECDCRKVIIQIFHYNRHVSTANYGWEDEEFYVKWMGIDDEFVREMSGWSIDITSPDCIPSDATLLFLEALSNNTWLNHIKATYTQVRKAVKES